MSSARVIKEHDSADSGSSLGSPQNPFAKLARQKRGTEEFGNAENDKDRQTGVSFEDMINNGAEMSRTMSITGQPDSPGANIRNSQLKEALRKHYQKESMPVADRYSAVDGTQLQIEGPYHMQDFSYPLVN